MITVDTGVPGPGRIVTADTEFFNNAEDPEGEFIYLNTIRDTGARTVLRADVTERRDRSPSAACCPARLPTAARSTRST